MTESIGTARLDIVVDTSSLDAGVTKAKRTTQEMAKASRDASSSMEVNSKRQIASLEKQIATLGKSKDEIIRWRIEQQTSGKVAADLAAKLEQQVKHLNNGGKALNAYGISAKQSAAALRGVPAQITDIAVALQSGQRPITVLLQQGGQLKDMFGGIVPAARALGGAVAGLINPFTLGAAAALGLGAAMFKAESQATELQKAIILTGGSANVTAAQLRAMAADIDKSTNSTATHATEVLAQVTATGRFAGEQIGLVAKAAINMQEATGQATEETVQDFIKLADAPSEYILKLNEAGKVNNFLTEATIATIKKLEEQGKTSEAAAVAFQALADTINTRTGQINENLNSSQAIWRSMKSAIGETGDSVVQFFSRSDVAVQAFLSKYQNAAQTIASILSATHIPGLSEAGRTLDSIASNAAANNRSNGAGLPTFAIPGVSSKPFNATDGIVNSKAYRARTAAEEEFGKLRESHLSQAKKLENEIAHIREVGAKAGVKQSEIDEQIAAARAAAATGSGGGGGRVRGGGGGRSTVRALPDFGKNAEEEARRLAAAEDAATQAFLDQQAALDGPLAQAEREHAKRVEQLNALAAASPVARAGLTDALGKEAEAHRQNIEAIKAELDPLGQLRADMQAELEMIGKSNAERAVMIELRRQHIDVMSAEGQAALANARTFETEAEAKQRSIDLMDRFRAGAADALTDFVTGAKSAKDALKDFFNELAAQITRAIAEQWIAKAFGSQGSSGTGSSGGWISALLGAFAGGSAKGNAFDKGNVQAFAYGGVVDRTTPFGMSGGRFGIMGEAGPEAILPLHRGPDGKLGVRMEAANEDRRPAGPTVVNQTVVVQGRIDSRTPAQFAQATAREQNRASTRNR